MKRIKRKQLKEILERLEALEWVVKEMHAEAAQERQSHDCCGGRDREGQGCWSGHSDGKGCCGGHEGHPHHGHGCCGGHGEHHHHGHPHHHRHPHHHGHCKRRCACKCGCGGRCGCGGSDQRREGKFDEKRVVDLIVSLLSERLDRTLGPLLERLGASRPKLEPLDERQIVDRIVSLVSERVEKLVVERIGKVMDLRRDATATEPGGDG